MKISQLSARRYFYRILALFLSSLFTVVIVCVLTQDSQIIPGAVASRALEKGVRVSPLPTGVEGQFVNTSDGERLEVWRYPAVAPPPDTRFKVAIIFHGNPILFSNTNATQCRPNT